MSFAKVGRIIAWIALTFGAVRVGMGFFVASFDDPAQRAAAASRYLGSAGSGESINQGVYTILIAICIGILSSIGIALNDRIK